MRQNKLLFIAALSSLVLSNFLNVFLPLSIGWFYEVVLNDHGTKSNLLHLFPISITGANSFFTMFAVLLILKTGFAFLEKYTIGVLGERFSRELRDMAFSHQLKHTMASHRLRPVGKYLLRYSGDLIAIQNLMSKGVLVFAGDVVFLCSSIGALFFLNKSLAFPVIIMFALSGIIIFLLSKQVRNAAFNRRTQRSLNLGFVSSRMQAFYTIKSFNRETPEQNSFINRSSKLYKLGVKFVSISSLVRVLPSLFFFATLGVVLYRVAQLRDANADGISKGDVFAFVLLLLYLQTVLKRLLRVNIVWQVGTISFNKLLTLIQLPAESRPTEKSGVDGKGEIIFKNVTFGYTNKNPINKNISFEVKPNSITIIQGRQGVGKSTLLKLIQKLYEPQSGQILLDGIDYASLTPFEVRKETTIVSDEVPLLGGTLFKAVSYNTSNDKREKVINMLKRLDINPTGDDEKNLQFKLEDGGKNISAGERTKLQFARAFLTRKNIVLIDDVFNNLDEEGLKIIVEQLNKLKSKRTIIAVTNTIPQNLIIDKIIQLQ